MFSQDFASQAEIIAVLRTADSKTFFLLLLANELKSGNAGTLAGIDS